MNIDDFQHVFCRPRVLLPVVHPIGEAEALEAIRVVARAGCRGLFLIDQGMSADDVLALVLRVRHELPALWVGVNLLGLAPAEALTHALAALGGRLDGLWCDDAGIEADHGALPRAQDFLRARQELGWTGTYFGGVAFKYQRDVPFEHLAEVATIASRFVDVIGTSGLGTGRAADTAKVRAMRSGVPEHVPLALASGVSEENVGEYGADVQAYLVGTALETSLGVLDAARVARLREKIEGA